MKEGEAAWCFGDDGAASLILASPGRDNLRTLVCTRQRLYTFNESLSRVAFAVHHNKKAPAGMPEPFAGITQVVLFCIVLKLRHGFELILGGA